MPNPTLDTADYSREIIEETIRPALSSYLDTEFSDPESGQRGQSIPDEPGTWPPLVVTALPGGGRVLYPHVVLQEFDDSGGPIDARLDFAQHDFAVKAIIHATTTTQMFNLRGLVRGWFLESRDLLRDAGWVLEGQDAISGSPASWDPTSSTKSWELTVAGTLHTAPST